MSILFIGDIHVKHNNVREVEIMEEIIKNKMPIVDYILLAGDILDAHEKIDSQLMNRAYGFIKSLRSLTRVIILVGNHDYINNKQYLTENHWMNGMKEWSDVTIVDFPIMIDDFVFVPYVFPGRFLEALDNVPNWKSARCIFAHQEIKGCKMGGIISIDGDVWDESYPMLISGHIHERHKPQSNVYYPGSCINHAFGYDSQGVFVFEFNDKSFIESRLELGFEKKKTIKLSVDGATNYLREKDLVDSVKYQITGTEPDIAAFKQSKIYKKMMSKKVKVTFSLDARVDKTRIVPGDKRGSFIKILNDLVKSEDDPILNADYKTLFSL